jgi:hypothetical protein
MMTEGLFISTFSRRLLMFGEVDLPLDMDHRCSRDGLQSYLKHHTAPRAIVR